MLSWGFLFGWLVVLSNRLSRNPSEESHHSVKARFPNACSMPSSARAPGADGEEAPRALRPGRLVGTEGAERRQAIAVPGAET